MNDKNHHAWLSIEDGKPVKFAELAHLMAKALHPSDDELMDYGAARVNLDEELPKAVKSGELVVRNAASLGRQNFAVGHALEVSVILPQDLASFLDGRGIELRCGKQQTRPVAIDWEFWKDMRKAKEWQACALSLNIEPDSMTPHPQAWMAGPDSVPLFTADSFPSNEVQGKFDKRFKLLRANRYDRAIFTLPMAKYSGLSGDEVLLSEFVAWGLSINWSDMPPELVALVRPSSPFPPAQPQLDQLSPIVSADEWDTVVAQEDEARKDPAYKAAYDRAMNLYIERDRLLECFRQDHSYQNSEIQKRLSQIRKEIAETEVRLGDVSLAKATTKEHKSLSPKKRIQPQGGDSLTPIIWGICYGLQEQGTKVTARPVMAELKRMAGEKSHPLISTTAGGVKYEYEKGDEKELTSQQLDKRIQEWRKVGG